MAPWSLALRMRGTNNLPIVYIYLIAHKFNIKSTVILLNESIASNIVIYFCANVLLICYQPNIVIVAEYFFFAFHTKLVYEMIYPSTYITTCTPYPSNTWEAGYSTCQYGISRFQQLHSSYMYVQIYSHIWYNVITL